MRNVNLLIKPASSLCNLRCKYCFYEDESENRTQKCMGIMQEDVADRLIDAAFSALDDRGSVSFSFQGGEPTMAGLAFFEHFVAAVQKKKPAGVQASYAIQTNGTLLDERWAGFFRKNSFLVGLSIDGNRALHDENRVEVQGKGTYARAVSALELLQRAGVDVNLLCVVTRRCASSPQRVYQALRNLNVGYLQFIPCLDPLDAQRGSMRYSLTPALLGSFLCTLFDLWYADWKRGSYVSIRQFDDYVHLALGVPPSTCSSSGRCGGYLVIESDGSAYPCDFYALDQWRLGSLMENTVEELMSSPRYAEFVRQSADRPKQCTACAYFPLCHGGCRRDWQMDAHGNRNYFCPAYQKLFAYAAGRIAEIARAERMAQMMG